MSIQLRIAGQSTSSEEAKTAVRGMPPSADSDQLNTHLFDAIEVLGAFDVSERARSEGDKPKDLEAEDDDLIEFVLEDGMSMWTSVAAYRDRQYQLKPELRKAKRLEIEPVLMSNTANRGMVKDLVTGVIRIIRLKSDEILEQAKDPTQWPEWLKNYGFTQFEKLGGWLTAKLIIWLIERKIQPEEGLYRWVKPLKESASSLETPATIPSDKPILLFIHGTASNTNGSFGALHSGDASSEWDALTQSFKDGIYAFEHRTMSHSPIENALILAKALPVGAQLSLVSHSRGGQVADLLCLKDLSSEHVQNYRRKDGQSIQADEYDRLQLAELSTILRKKNFTITRLIRVACPTQGTLLLSENLDRFLSVLTSLIGLIPVVGQSPVYQVVKRITLEAAKSRWDPTHIPGLEAMLPQSPLVALLNHPKIKAEGDLGVIAGDIEGGSLFKRIGAFITDTFIYDNQDNDLVVNTNSMFHGVPRGMLSRYIFDQGSDVSHFRYFRNARTRHLLVQSMTSSSEKWPSEFRPLEEAKVAPVPMLRSIQTRSGISQPVVFILPGIMGSELQANKEDVWLDYWSLFLGHIDKIAMGAPDVTVTVTGLVSSYYRQLCDYLADSHEVIPFGYDWRFSIADSARKLAVEVSRVVERTDEPIRFMAHSMGGLVVRRFIQDNPELWTTLCERKGARFIMLGTPNRGSYDTVELLAGMSKTIKQLALLDFDHSTKEIVEIVAAFQGALELLPQEQEQEKEWKYFTDHEWTKLQPHTDSKVQIGALALQAAQNALADLPRQIPRADCIRYVAGWAPRTVCGLNVKNNRLSFQATAEGDGRVTYKSGLLPDIPVWYVDAEHGDLADHKPVFPAYRDLLEQGVTTRLSTTPISADRGGDTIFDYEPEPVLYPTPSDFEAGLLGKRRKSLKVHTSEKLQVSVLHGDLTQTNYPIMVSHYEGDTIAGAEGVVDRLVNSALTQRYHLGLYPGRPGTAAVVLAQLNEVQKGFEIRHGALVIGLGRWGELTPTALTQAVQQGAMEYCVQFAQCCGSTESSQKSSGLTINSLLIGSNTSANIAVEDSVNAIVRGVIFANRALLKQDITFPRVAHLQFIELYLDVAVDAAKATHRVVKRIELELQAEIEASRWLKKGKGGLTRLVPSSTRGYWRRWTVTAVPHAATLVPCSLPAALQDRLRMVLQKEKTNDPRVLSALLDLAFKNDGDRPRTQHQLRYLALSDRARAEVTVQNTQSDLIAELIQSSTTSSAFRQDIAKTLYELLIPPDLKDKLLTQNRVVFVLDEVTANYPWELMIDIDRPLCVRIGIIRQLETIDHEVRVRDTTSKAVYVVGDPLTPSNYQELPGAQKEAELVASLLKAERYEVNHSRQRLGALDVMNQLFAQPYRIIHIAGHGHFSGAETEKAGAKAGVVLDNGLFLTATEISMLDPIPELVFLNCCYLGQISGTSNGTAYNKVAASISRELIKKGVRAVIAAGWPVRDDAALCFAQVFYKELLANQPFGEAILEARKQTWEKFQESNTWGAYQAYGDPDFRLNLKKGSGKNRSEEEPVAAEEVLIALQRISSKTDESGKAKLQEGLLKLKGQCSIDWLKQGNIQDQFGQVYGNAGLFDEAVQHYAQAAKGEDLENSATLRAIEQWINLEVRFGRKKQDKAKIKQAIKRGQQLLKIAETSERWSILGSAYKKLAELGGTSNEVNAHLKDAAQYYQKAVMMEGQESSDPYPIMNWLTIESILENTKVPYESWLAKSEILAQQRFQAKHEVWDLFATADIALLRAMQSGMLPKERTKIVNKYREVFAESAANQKEQDSALSQISFMRDSLKKLPSPKQKQKARAKTIKALDEIHAQLKQSDQKENPSSGEESASRKATKPPRTRKRAKTQSARSKPAPAKSPRRTTRQGKGKKKRSPS